MKEFIPRMEKALNFLRQKSDEKLIKEGATLKPDGRLSVTENQIREARAMMQKDFNERITYRRSGQFENFEGKVFDPTEIQVVIANLEEVEPEEILLTYIETDNEGRIISMQFKLKEEIAYLKYKKDVEYDFVIKGKFHQDNTNEDDEEEDTTQIRKLISTSTERRGLSIHEKLALTEEDFTIARFDGEKWNKVERWDQED